MNRHAVARSVVFDAIKDVLPGRVFVYPPSRNGAASVAPALWLGESSAGANFIGDLREWTVQVPIRIVVDGADHSAHAMLDELKSAVFEALEARVDCEPDDVAPEPFDVDGATTLPGATFNVSVAVHDRTWCPPIPEPALFPPVPIGV